MSMRLSRALLALCALPLSLGGPAHADQLYGGTGCRLAAVLAPTPDDLGHVSWYLTGGPVYATATPTGGDTPGPGTNVRIDCSVQFNSDDPASADQASVSSLPGVGAAVLPPTEIALSPGASDAIYVCGAITWTDPDGNAHTQDFDADLAPGAQCARYVHTVVFSGGR